MENTTLIQATDLKYFIDKVVESPKDEARMKQLKCLFESFVTYVEVRNENTH